MVNAQIHKKIGEGIKKKDKLFSGGVSSEGAWIANMGNTEAFDIIAKTCEEVGNEYNFECGFGIDVAAASMWKEKEQKYFYTREGKKLDTGEQLEYLLDLIETYRLVYVEDPFDENDFESFAELTKKTKNCLICGDDLFTTNNERLSQGIKLKAANSIIIKVNQIGTLTDALETIETAQKHGYTTIVSHRSGDTCACHIAHLAISFKCPIIKTGTIEGARIAKLNELLRIEHFLGNRAKMANLKIN
jgi:enolase